MKRTRRRTLHRGMTLIEILTVIVVFGIFLTLAATTLVRCYASYVSNSDVQVNFRDASVGLDKMSRQLAHCQQVYAPDPAALWTENASATPTPGAPFVFAYQQPEVSFTPAVGTTLPSAPLTAVGYQLNANTHALQRLIYGQGQDPTSSAPVEVQLIASPVLSFSVVHVARGNDDQALTVSVYATIPGEMRNLPLFFQTQVLEIQDGI